MLYKLVLLRNMTETCRAPIQLLLKVIVKIRKRGMIGPSQT